MLDRLCRSGVLTDAGALVLPTSASLGLRGPADWAGDGLVWTFVARARRRCVDFRSRHRDRASAQGCVSTCADAMDSVGCDGSFRFHVRVCVSAGNATSHCRAATILVRAEMIWHSSDAGDRHRRSASMIARSSRAAAAREVVEVGDRCSSTSASRLQRGAPLPGGVSRQLVCVAK